MTKEEAGYRKLTASHFFSCANCGQRREHLTEKEVRGGLVCFLVSKVDTLNGSCGHHSANYNLKNRSDISETKPQAESDSSDSVQGKLRDLLKNRR